MHEATHRALLKIETEKNYLTFLNERASAEDKYDCSHTKKVHNTCTIEIFLFIFWTCVLSWLFFAPHNICFKSSFYQVFNPFYLQ